MDCVVYLVCRGQTTNDILPRPLILGRKTDANLTAEGRTVVRQFAQSLCRRSLDMIYTSPAFRATETARLLLNACPTASLRIASALAAQDCGAWEGWAWHRVIAEASEAFGAYLQDPAGQPMGGGESLGAVQERAVQFLHDRVAQHHEQRVAMVTHPAVIRAMIAGVVDLPLWRARDLDQMPGRISVIRVAAGSLSVVAVNQMILDEADETDEAKPRIVDNCVSPRRI